MFCTVPPCPLCLPQPLLWPRPGWQQAKWWWGTGANTGAGGGAGALLLLLLEVGVALLLLVVGAALLLLVVGAALLLLLAADGRGTALYLAAVAGAVAA